MADNADSTPLRGRRASRAAAIRKEVQRLRDRGLAVCKVDPGEKRPTYTGWSTFSLSPEAFGPDSPVGILGGPLSSAGNPGHALVIIDLDTAEANALADEYLPATGMVEGRPGKPRSHRYYLVPFDSIPDWGKSQAEQGAPAAEKAAGHPGPFKKQFHHRETEAVVIDFIGTGGQCVCPPSLHPSGEQREWEGGAPGDPAVVPFVDLWDAVGRLASASGAEVPRVIHEPPEPTPAAGSSAPGSPFKMRVPTADEQVEKRATGYLEKTPAAVSKQGGHSQTFNAARAVVYGFNLGVERGLRLLLDHYNPRCQPQWTEKELRHKCQDADALPFRKPRGWLLAERDTSATGGTTATGDDLPPWPELLPIGEVPEPPPFPIDVFPPPAQRIIRAIAAAVNCPIDYPAVAALGIISGAVAGRVRLVVKKGWTVSGALYVAYIAPPGDGKTAPLGILRTPLDTWEAKKRADWESKTKDWEKKQAEADDDTDDDQEPKPRLTRRIVSNTTMESLLPVLRDNPVGLIQIRNELSGLCTAMGQYKAGKGDDRQQYIDLWDGTPIHHDRKSNKEAPFIHIEKPCLTILGTLQPAVVHLLHGDDGRRTAGTRIRDGFFDRFLLSWANAVADRADDGESVADGAVLGWESLVTKLLDLDADYRAGFTQPAWAAWVKFTDDIATERNSGTLTDLLREQWAKLKTYGARLAIVVHALRYAAGEVTSLVEVDEVSLGRAVHLVKYFMGHAKKVAGEIDADPAVRKARRIVRWIREKAKDTSKRLKVSRHTLHRSLRGSADFNRAEDMDEPLNLLCHHHYLRLLPVPPGKVGRHAEEYEINPDLFAESPECNTRNTQNPPPDDDEAADEGGSGHFGHDTSESEPLDTEGEL